MKFQSKSSSATSPEEYIYAACLIGAVTKKSTMFYYALFLLFLIITPSMMEKTEREKNKQAAHPAETSQLGGPAVPAPSEPSSSLVFEEAVEEVEEVVEYMLTFEG